MEGEGAEVWRAPPQVAKQLTPDDKAYYEGVLRDVLSNVAITNVVATFVLNVDNINLSALALACKWAHHSQPTFAALITRIQNPRATCLLYERGVVVCMGTKNEASALLACHRLVSRIREAAGLEEKGIPLDIIGMYVFNYVASIYVFPVNLEYMAKKFTFMVDYKASNFPGATIRCKNMPGAKKTRVTGEMFNKGKGNITGALSIDEIVEYIIRMYWEVLIHCHAKNSVRLTVERGMLEDVDFDLDVEGIVNRDVNPGLDDDADDDDDAGTSVGTKRKRPRGYSGVADLDVDAMADISDLLRALKGTDDDDDVNRSLAGDLDYIGKNIEGASTRLK